MDYSAKEKVIRVYNWIILIFLLLVRILQSFTNLTYDFFVNSENLIDFGRLENISLFLYGILMFGGFPIIASIVVLNEKRLYQMNIDKTFPYLLLLAGLLGLYFVPYNCIAIAAIAYYSYVFFIKSAAYSQLDKETSKKIFFAVGFFIFFLSLSLIESNTPFTLLGDLMPIPIYEELIFRGLLLMLLNEIKIKLKLAFVISVILFAISHVDYLLQNPFVFWIYIPLGGTLLGYIVVKWKSLTLSALVHLALNTLTYYLI